MATISTCSFSSNMETVEVAAIGTCVAISKALQTSHCSEASSAQAGKCMLPLSESAEARLNCCADARPQFACDLMAIFLGPDGQPSNAPPRETALQAEIARGGLDSPSSV